ncbi:hypothetical protein OH540_06850 [Streptomyces sp. BPPL-273]|uniref:hypothetical protein n=1 Tax=Streptomyces TaxID=1883 RepID=UPI001CFA82E6|nr:MULTISPECIES: hypothetical protein [Streptomyces]WHM29753.1 hypothetical protein OH540_06850 [Streptomyces sp. BPPL-273]
MALSALSHPAGRGTETAADRQPGPNQWIKDHLDSVIDAELLGDTSAEPAAARPGARP